MNNLLIERIQNAVLTKQQKVIADYFIKNQKRICNLSTLEVANEIGVSDASIIRFSRSIGFEGFSDLKDSVYIEMVQEMDQKVGLLPLAERLKKKSEQYKNADFFQVFKALMIANVNKSLSQNAHEDYIRVANSILSANHRYIIGQRGCKGIAVQFSRLLQLLLDHVSGITDGESDSLGILQSVKSDDVIVMFCFARYYKIDNAIMKLVKSRGAKICLIVDNILSPLVPFADTVLLAETDHMNFSNSTLGTVAIAEFILTIISQKQAVMQHERFMERDEMTSEFLIGR